jgi:hypothetical protein
VAGGKRPRKRMKISLQGALITMISKVYSLMKRLRRYNSALSSCFLMQLQRTFKISLSQSRKETDKLSSLQTLSLRAGGYTSLMKPAGLNYIKTSSQSTSLSEETRLLM